LKNVGKKQDALRNLGAVYKAGKRKRKEENGDVRGGENRKRDALKTTAPVSERKPRAENASVAVKV
jgi:hypothetical protein